MTLCSVIHFPHDCQSGSEFKIGTRYRERWSIRGGISNGSHHVWSRYFLLYTRLLTHRLKSFDILDTHGLYTVRFYMTAYTVCACRAIKLNSCYKISYCTIQIIRIWTCCRYTGRTLYRIQTVNLTSSESTTVYGDSLKRQTQSFWREKKLIVSERAS